ncbi:alpha-galactosidase [Flavobacterium aurantiibacter]|uniref:Alpha-galactosidase n=2 Tax=Flavobacterium aurantiibacter TaxID=2023067 RepID=A0A256A844_9FLAO|nr:alpha-galactosidase [Flavobacterium aurantiibacter]
MNKLFRIFVCCCSISIFAQKPAGLAKTPPMGWNSWNTFETNINEELVKKTADALVASGMKDAGYLYLVLDDGWMAKERDENGNLVPDPVKFPSGLPALIDYVHKKGLKFGLYNCAGTKTCAGYPGTRGYEYQDARFYAKLGIDFLKYDWCNTEGIQAKEAYTTMRNALAATKKPIIFSLCEWGDNQPWLWATDIGQMWRISGDIYPCFDCEYNHGTWSSWGVLRILEMRKDIRKYAGPDHFNDFDMLEVGNGMTAAEDRSHFALWCMMASPLIAGNDITKMNQQTRDLLTNRDLIAINQDELGLQGFKFHFENGIDYWAKPLANNQWAFAFLNRSESAAELNFDFSKWQITDPDFGHQFNAKQQVYEFKFLFENKTANTKRNLKTKIEAHDICVIRLREKK